jgi:RNA polymerase sigma-70 factor, ECF subfamily
MGYDAETSRSRRDAESTSMSLLGRVKAGEGEAWRRLVDLYGPSLYNWCRRRNLEADEAADVAQEVFVAVFRNIGGFHRDRPGDSFRGWLCQITENKIRDYFRKQGRQPDSPGGTTFQQRIAEVAEPLSAASCSVPSADCGSSLEWRAIELVRASVEERTWKAFCLNSVEGKDAATVAKELGISVQAVYDAGYRIRRKVRQELERLIE